MPSYVYILLSSDTTIADDEGHRAVIIVTDGRSTGNLRGMDELIAHALTSNVSISAMDYAPAEWFLPDRAERARFAANPADVRRDIASASGGRYVVISAAPASRGGSVDFKAITKDLRKRMTAMFGGAPEVTIPTEPLGASRRLEFKPDDDVLLIRSRLVTRSARTSRNRRNGLTEVGSRPGGGNRLPSPPRFSLTIRSAPLHSCSRGILHSSTILRTSDQPTSGHVERVGLRSSGLRRDHVFW